ANDGQHHRVHILHIDRAATPQAAVGELAGEGIVLPVGGVGGDDVQVAVDEEGGSCLVLARDAGYHGGALGVGFQELRLEAGVGEEFGDVLGGGSLAGAGVVAGIRGVDAEQVAADVDDLVLRGGRVRCHRFIVPLGAV